MVLVKDFELEKLVKGWYLSGKTIGQSIGIRCTSI